MPNPNFALPKCPIYGGAIKRDGCAACNAAYIREYADLHANDLSWREDYRRVPADKQFDATIGSALALPSRRITGHWQRRSAA